MNPIKHVAIIMDGNGRWGLKHYKSRNHGHRAGLKTVEKIIKDRDYVESVLKEGANKALEVSTPLIEDIRNSVGIKGF